MALMLNILPVLQSLQIHNVAFLSLTQLAQVKAQVVAKPIMLRRFSFVKATIHLHSHLELTKTMVVLLQLFQQDGMQTVSIHVQQLLIVKTIK